MFFKLPIIALIFVTVFSSHAHDRLKDRVAFITGGSQGIGKGIAEVFAQQGAKVIIISRTEEKLKETAQKIKENGGHIDYFVADITNPEAIQKVVTSIIQKYGRLDILIHNAAGIYPFKKVEDMSYEEWGKAINTNLNGVFLVTKAVLPQMKKQKYGRIVYTSSISGPRVGLPGKSHYTAAKAGLNGFMKTVAIELAEDNITVNAVEPGNIETEGLRAKNSPEAIQARVAPIPMKRLGTPHEVAYAHLFLASDEAQYITGQSIIIDGGQTLPEDKFGF